MTTMSRTDLPKIVQYLGITDSGEYGNAVCPHCGADGRYVHRFICDDGTTRGAMAGCVQQFPVSPVAEEHKKIAERARDRAKTGRKLASWDETKLAAIDACGRRELSEADTLAVIRRENTRRDNWMRNNRRGGRR